MIKLHPQNEQVVFKPFMGILDEHFPVNHFGAGRLSPPLNKHKMRKLRKMRK